MYKHTTNIIPKFQNNMVPTLQKLARFTNNSKIQIHGTFGFKCMHKNLQSSYNQHRIHKLDHIVFPQAQGHSSLKYKNNSTEDEYIYTSIITHFLSSIILNYNLISEQIFRKYFSSIIIPINYFKKIKRKDILPRGQGVSKAN